MDTVKKYWTSKYDFAISETKTMHVIEDVGNSLSEIGILYLSNYNRRFMMKQFDEWNLEFHKLANCDAFVFCIRGIHWLRKNQLRMKSCCHIQI